MTTQQLDIFLTDLMGINGEAAAMGSAHSGIVGATNSSDAIVIEMRKNAIAFSKEYRVNAQDKAPLRARAEQLEGSIQGLRLVSAISEEHCERLLAMLQALI